MTLPSSGSHHRGGARPYPLPEWPHQVTEKQRAGMRAALYGWVNTRQLATICRRASGNAAERECRNAAVRLGFIWLKIGVNHEETEERPLRVADHFLYAMAYPRQVPPTFDKPLRNNLLPGSWDRLCEQTGWKTAVEPHLRRTDQQIRERREQLGLGV